jgi:pyruvate carboxylase
MEPVDLGEAAAAAEKKVGQKLSRTDLMSYLMYPDVFAKFAKARQSYGDVEVLPTPQFFYGMKKDEEISVELEPGKTLIVKYSTTSNAHPDGTRTVFFELNGQPREARVRDKALKAEAAVRDKADPTVPGQVAAPIPGAVTSVAAELNQTVAKGDKLLVLEAMKMQTTVYAPVAGRVMKRLVQPGETVEPKDLLMVIE